MRTTMTLVSCSMNRFSKNVNLANAGGSLATVCCNKPFLHEGKVIIIIITALLLSSQEHVDVLSQRYSTPDMVIDFQGQTNYALLRTVLIKSRSI